MLEAFIGAAAGCLVARWQSWALMRRRGWDVADALAIVMPTAGAIGWIVAFHVGWWLS